MPGKMSDAERKRRSRAASTLAGATAVLKMYGHKGEITEQLDRIAAEIVSGEAQRTGPVGF